MLSIIYQISYFATNKTFYYTFVLTTQSHFGYVFKKYIGMTPGEYRKTHYVGQS